MIAGPRPERFQEFLDTLMGMSDILEVPGLAIGPCHAFGSWYPTIREKIIKGASKFVPPRGVHFAARGARLGFINLFSILAVYQIFHFPLFFRSKILGDFYCLGLDLHFLQVSFHSSLFLSFLRSLSLDPPSTAKT